MIKVKEIVGLCAAYLGMESLEKAYESNLALSSDDAEKEKDILRCLNLVVGELAINYIPCTKKRTISIMSSGEYLFSSLSDNLINVIALWDKNNKETSFMAYSDRILAKTGVYTLEYTYLPKKLVLSDELPFPYKYPITLFAYGILREICLVYERNNEAYKWENLYVSQLDEFCKEKKSSIKNAKIKPRRWLN